MARKQRTSTKGVDAGAPLASWRIHHLTEDGGRSAAATGAVLVACLVTVALLGNGLLAWTLVVAFLWSMSDFFLPYHYTVTGREVVVRTPISEKRVSWRRIRGVSEATGGILLTPLPRRSLLDRFRGMFLHVSPEDRERVLECVRGLLGRNRAEV